MSKRDSRFSKEIEATNERGSLAILTGDFSVNVNPVDTYLSGKSPATKRMVISHMNKVAILFGYPDYKHTPWSSMRFIHVSDLTDILKDQKYAHTTINAIISAVRGTAKAAMLMNMMSYEDYGRLISVDMVKGFRLPTGRMLSQGEIQALVDACLNDYIKPGSKNAGDKRSPASYRDLAILGMLFVGGLRRAEVADLDVEDIDMNSKEVRVIGKGNKERIIFLDEGTIVSLKNWLKLRGDFDGSLFYAVNRGGNIVAGRLSDQAIYNMVKKRQRLAGITSSISPHDFRKTFISTILDRTGDLSAAQILAGHSDPKTTASYDRRKHEDIRKVAGCLHLPVGKG